MSRACFAAGRHGRACDHARQRHHIVKQQHIRLRHRSLTAAHRRGGPKPPWRLHVALKDPRLWRWICWHHHQLETSSKLQVLERDLPDGFWEAVAEYGLEPWVPSHLPNPEEAKDADV
jgi:hypothetical protein